MLKKDKLCSKIIFFKTHSAKSIRESADIALSSLSVWNSSITISKVKDFINKYIDRKDFELIEIDADYLQITIDSVIKDGLSENVIEKYHQRMPVLLKLECKNERDDSSNSLKHKSNLI